MSIVSTESNFVDYNRDDMIRAMLIECHGQKALEFNSAKKASLVFDLIAGREDQKKVSVLSNRSISMKSAFVGSGILISEKTGLRVTPEGRYKIPPRRTPKKL